MEPIPSKKIRPLEFGKCYIVTVNKNFELQWNIPTGSVKDSVVFTEPKVFIPEEKLDYTVIDVLDIPSNVKEIGVFEDEKCIGAVAVDEPSEQILVYNEQIENKEHSPYVFKVITDNSKSKKVNAYKVYDEEIREYVIKELYSGEQDYAIVSFKTNDNSISIPSGFALEQNYPNPFNPITQIKYSLSEVANVKIKIYNILGNEVATLVNQQQFAGLHKVEFDGSKISSGLYFYKLEVNGKDIGSKKMMLMK